MPPLLGEAMGDLSDDDYVARLLASEARENSLKYSSRGLEAYMPQRPTGSAPKPNTRFLRHIIKETDSHNAALKRKEEREARERMRQLRGQMSGRREREHSKEPESKRRERREPRDREDKDRSRRRRERSRSASPGRDRSRRHRQRQETTDDTDDRQTVSRRRRRESREPDRRRPYSRSRSRSPRRERRSDTTSSQHRRHKRSSRRSATPRRSRSRSPRTREEERRKYKSDKSTTKPGYSSRETTPRKTGVLDSTHRDDDAEDESDPLEDLVGPLPPRRDGRDDAPIRSRGRGAYKSATSNIDAHFAPDYDPSLDVQVEDDGLAATNQSTRRPVAGLMTKDDDWELALEALRDRAKWRQKGEERLRDAGFHDSIVERWKSNEAPAGAEGRLEDVKWSKRGESREWDRGKVVDEAGDIDVKAPW
ncbi:hypothetical protein ASPZODRAFT_123841 [Penicilliopsis zonata CBS 506.65]|uniref:Pre-mRNA-splicing factor 38B n=1 Tax=Penicilliopsis zonata CBS 506.65 TaxID=1073090 RepID=A0A1L9S8K5_9EURO|nr:hypothetical protein ASPZODRAFT_123841 [Penicilliopsis zonata CBS 506.65]OJJ43486.1 hypothetical protein ASPZODRAFT_123841 [Penicilliopsis zonata CBS 506.65]